MINAHQGFFFISALLRIWVNGPRTDLTDIGPRKILCFCCYISLICYRGDCEEILNHLYLLFGFSFCLILSFLWARNCISPTVLQLSRERIKNLPSSSVRRTLGNSGNTECSVHNFVPALALSLPPRALTVSSTSVSNLLLLTFNIRAHPILLHLSNYEG